MIELMSSIIVIILVIFFISRVKKDARIFTKLITCMVISLIVGFGIKSMVNGAFTTDLKSKTIINNSTAPIHSVPSSFVLKEDTLLIPDCVGKEIKTVGDSIVDNSQINTNSIPNKVDYLDDS